MAAGFCQARHLLYSFWDTIEKEQKKAKRASRLIGLLAEIKVDVDPASFQLEDAGQGIRLVY